MDQYLVYGEDYKTVREAVAKAIIKGRTQSIDEAIQVRLFGPSFPRYCSSDFIYSILCHLYIEMYSKKKGLLYPFGPFPRGYKSISSSQPSSPSQTRGLIIFLF